MYVCMLDLLIINIYWDFLVWIIVDLKLNLDTEQEEKRILKEELASKEVCMVIALKMLSNFQC